MQQITKNLNDFIARVHRGEDTILLPRQFETFIRMKDFISKGYTKGKVIKPTGIGKTVIFSKFIEAVLNGLEIKVLIVGPTKIILHQNQGKLDAFGGVVAGKYYGPEKNLSQQVTVTTYHSLRNLVKEKKINPLDYSILILDEAHRALGPDTMEAIDTFDHAIQIGFTATPEFSEERSIANILPYTIDEMSVRDAIEDDLLAGLRVFVITTGVSTESVERAGKEFDEESLTRTINTPERNRFIVEKWKDPRFCGKRTVAYCASRKHGKALTQEFCKAGVKAAYIDALTQEFEREEMFAQFKDGTLDVLCNVGVLIEGFDESEAEICLNATPTLSKLVAEQRGGRVLRRSKVKDSKVGYIIEILDEFGTSSNTPILFSEIAGAAEILSPSNIEEIEKKKGRSSITRTTRPKPGDVIDDPALVMFISNRNKRLRFTKSFQYAPRGWVYARKLAHELRRKEGDIRVFAEAFSGSRPDWFQRYLTPTDILVTHYAPQLVNLVRREFEPGLRKLITPEEYASDVGTTDNRASNLLNAADVSATKKAVRFEDTAYFSPEEHIRIIRNEERHVRSEEARLVDEAEMLFWQDDERTDEQRESDYWTTFEPITSERYDVEETTFAHDPLLDDEEILPFDEDNHREDVSFHSNSPSLSRAQETAVSDCIWLLRLSYARTLSLYFFEEKSCVKIGEMQHVTRSCIDFQLKRALRELRRPWFMHFLRYELALADGETWFLEGDYDHLPFEIVMCKERYKKWRALCKEKRKNAGF